MFVRATTPDALEYYEEERRRLEYAMKVNAEIFKNAPRVVYDHFNNDIDVRSGDHFTFGK